MSDIKIKSVSLENLATFSAQMKAKYAKKTDIPTTVSALANDAGYQTGEQVAAAINAKVASTYKAGGSVAFADLPALEETNLGLVVNVTDKFTTTDSFVEGAGKKHPAGTNVAVVKSGEEYKYDVLAGFVDLSGYVEKAEGQRLMTDAEGAKLEGIAAGATKVEASETNGAIKVNGVETTVYTLPGTVLHADNFEEIPETEILALFAEE